MPIDNTPGLARGPQPGLARGPQPGLARGPQPGLARGPQPGLAREPQPGLAREPQSINPELSINALCAQFDQTSLMEVPREVQETSQEILEQEFPTIPKDVISALLQPIFQSVIPYQGETSLDALVAKVYQLRSELLGNMVMDDLKENERRNGDLKDIRNMLDEMRKLLAGKKGDDKIDVEGSFLQPDPDSQLGQAAAEAKKLMDELHNDPEFQRWCANNNVDPKQAGSHLRIDSNGSMGVMTRDGKWKNVTLPPALKQKVKDLGLVEAANTVGGHLRSKGEVRLDVMLEYYGVKPSNPKTADEGLAAIESLKGISDTYGAKSQTEMMKLQQNMGKYDVNFAEWKKMFDGINNSKKEMLR